MIDASAARAGAQQANQALGSIGNGSTQAQRALDAATRAMQGNAGAAGRMAAGLRAANNNTGPLGAGLGGVGAAAAAATARLNTFAVLLRSIGPLALAFGGIGLAIAALSAPVIEATSRVEMLKANLVTVTGDVNSASGAFDRLAKFAGKTPFSIDQAVESFTKLSLLGLNPSERAMMSYGNTASALGKDLNQMIEAVADAATGEFERLKEFGIKSKVQGDQVAFTFAGLTTKVKNNATEIEEYLMKIGETNFAGSMDRQAATLGGSISALKDGIFLAFAAIGEGGLSQSFQGIFNGLASGLQQSLPQLQAFGATLGSIVTTVTSAVAPAFSFLINNLGTLIGVAKVAAMSFLVMKGALVVNAFTGVVTSIIGLEKALGATTAVSALFSFAMKVAQGAINGVTTALLANPFTALAVGITAVVGLLYQFSDQIKIGGGYMGSLADVANEAFDRMGPMLKNLKSVAADTFSGIKSALSSAFSGVAATFEPVTDAISSGWNSMFGDLDISLSGFVIGVARVADLVVGHFRGTYRAVVSIWGNMIDAIYPYIGWIVEGMGTAYNKIMSVWSGFASGVAGFFTSAFNWAASTVESFINKAISAINSVLGFANKLGLGIALLNPVTIGAVTAGHSKLGQDAAAAYRSGFGNGIENTTRDFFSGVDRRARGGGKTGGGLGNTGGGKPAAEAPGADGKGNGSSAADAAKKALEDIKTKTREFWTELEQAAKIAAMMPLDAARYNQELELRKILGGGILKDEIQLDEAQKARIANLMREKTIAESLTGLREDTRKAENISITNGLRLNGLSERELAIEDALTGHRQKALDAGATLADITSDTWKLEEARLATILRQNAAFDEQRAKLLDMQKAGRDHIDRYNREADPFGALRKDRAERDEAIRAAKPMEGESASEFARRVNVALKGSADEFERDMKAANEQFFSGFTNSIDSLAQTFGGKFGEVIGSLGNVFKSLSTTFKGDTGLGKLFGPGSKLVKGMEKFGQGAEMGAQIGALAKAVGIKGFSQTGSTIGGGIGAMIPIPGGKIIGSILGGIVGGLFEKPKHGNASFGVDAQGNVNVGAVTGSNAQTRSAATGMAGAVIEGLQSIATSLGGKLTGTPNMTLGTWDDRARVLIGQQTTKPLHSKNFNNRELFDFGDDTGAAVKFAIEQALKQGVITNLPDVVQKALNKLSTESAVSFAQSWANIMADLDSKINPVGSAVKSIIGPLDQLKETMVSIGASSADMAKLEEYRAAKLAETLKDQLSSLSSFQKALSGEGSGVTALSRLNTSMESFKSFQSDIAAGKQIDQGAFTALGQEIFQLAGGIYGQSTTAFQDIRAMLMGATEGAIGNTTSAFNDAQVVAIQQQTKLVEQQIQQQAVANDYLRQIAENSQNNGGGGGGGTTTVIGVDIPRSVNGQMTYY